MSNLGASKPRSSSFPNLPAPLDANYSRLPDSFQVSAQREKPLHSMLPQSSSFGNSLSSSSRLPSDIQISSVYPHDRHRQNSTISTLPNGVQSLSLTYSELQSTQVASYPEEPKEISWCPDSLQEFFNFPASLPDQNGLVDTSTGVIVSEDHAEKTDWSDMYPLISFDDTLDPYWELSVDDVAALSPKPEVLNHSLNIMVQQPRIQQHQPEIQQHHPEIHHHHPEIQHHHPPEIQQHHPEIQHHHPPEIQQHHPEIQHHHPPEIQQHHPEIQHHHPPEIQHHHPPEIQHHHPPEIQHHPPEIQQHRPVQSGEIFISPDPVPTGASTKSRMRWTQELHEAFVEAVDQLGGSERATPKGILNVMKDKSLTIYHVKSHLQKYRTARYKPESSEGTCERNLTPVEEMNSMDLRTSSLGITEALRLQVELQKRLHEQLESQRKLQLEIEEQSKYLEKMFEQQRKMEDERAKPTSSTSDEHNKIGTSTPIFEGSQDASIKQKEQECEAHDPPGDADSGAVPTKRARTG